MVSRALSPAASTELPNLVAGARRNNRRAVEAQRITETMLESSTRRQAIVVRLGMEALASRDLQKTLDLLVGQAKVALGVEFCSVLELAADRSTFLRRADTGWPHDVSGPAVCCALSDAQAAYTLQAAEPVTCPDLRKERRFAVPPLLLQQGVVSGMSVILHGQQQAWGVVGAHAKTTRTFTLGDINFLQAVASLMALAIERDRVETVLRHRNRQQAAVALLGRRALIGPHMDDLFADAAREVAATLQVDFSEVLQREPDGRTMLLRAGVGWQEGLVGTARVSSRVSSQAGFTLNATGPVVVTDLRTETRFEAPEILHEHGIVSGMGVLVPGRRRPFGILAVHSRAPRAFTQDDSNFLQAVANLLAAAIERHDVEGELRRHRDDLEGLVEERTALLAASNRELEAFSYTISHDLRAPLRGINGMSKILQRKHGKGLSDQAKSMLQEMVDETVRMGKLIESVLSLSRLGTVSLDPVPIDVSGTATSILRSLASSNPARGVKWTVEPGIRVVADEGLFKILLGNLLANAWKFTGQTQDARITVAAELDGFRVEDNGAGFDMAHSRELFQPFHRLHAGDEFEGTGIGLATVSRIASRHGGRVWAQGQPGKGAVFRVTLPQTPRADR